MNLQKQLLNRAYPSEDVATCRTLKQKYGQPLDVVAKDKCFYFSYAKENENESEDEDKMYPNILTLVCMGVRYRIAVIMVVTMMSGKEICLCL